MVRERTNLMTTETTTELPLEERLRLGEVPAGFPFG